MTRRCALPLLLAVAWTAGCAPEAPPVAAAAQAPPEPAAPPIWAESDPDPQIEAGRQVWLGTCVRCHAQGLAGAPPIGDRGAWAPRIAQGLPVLFEHALGGFEGPTGGAMPARGGNPDLNDEQVTAAVRFMVSRSGG